jgi:hypothetical protein
MRFNRPMKIRKFLIAALLAGAAAPVCAQVVFFDGFEEEVPEEVAYDCAVDGVMPPNFNPYVRSWTQTFSSPDGSPSAQYPNGVSFPTPVGANKGQMRIVPFTPNAEQSVAMYWDEAQSRPQEGYVPSRPSDGMWFAISPCPGDMRAPAFPAEAFLRPGCRQFGRSGALIWTTQASAGESDYTFCKLEAGKPYFMTISPTNALDGLQFGEHTCQSGDFGCDVGVILGTGN